MKKLVTHSGNFHADDVFATATLDLVFDGKVEVMRSRDPEIIEKGEIVYDVGQVYDPSKNRFDHHQTGGAGERENGVPYAAFGLIWKHFGKQLVREDEVWQRIDESLVQPIDANDTGYAGPETSVKGLNNYVVDSLIKSFNPTWTESYDLSYERFMMLVDFAKKVLQREIKKAKDVFSGKEFVEKAYEDAENKKIIVLDKGCSWREVLVSYPEPEFVIFPEIETDRFMIQAVNKSITGYATRKDFPKAWWGKVDSELSEISGVEGAIFCHNVGFLAVNETREGAIKMAEIAIANA